jgi:hypothetical protein
MKTKSIVQVAAALLLSTLNPQPSTCFAQGGTLTPPPGPPSPTMSSLSQVMTTLNQNEPRGPISSTPYTIAKPGAYYLTTNLTMTVGVDAIDINANGVTLDLNGFTISSTSPFDGGTAILLNVVNYNNSTGASDITISNGHITGGVTNKAGVFGGPGFNNGIGYFLAPPAPPFNVRVIGVTVSGCLYDGINLGTGNSTVVESCTVNTVGGSGIVASSVSHSTAIQCGNTAILADTASDCYGNSTGDDGVDSTFAANNCYGTSTGSAGISVQGNANSCYGNSGGAGDGLFALNNAENCYGTSSSGYGIRVAYGNASNCYGFSNSGNGLYAGGSADNCRGYCVGLGTGLNTFANANNCYGGCDGAGIGLSTGDSANNCSGYSATSGTGLSARIAIGCYGRSASGTGLAATVANSCISSSGDGSISNKYNMP